MHRTFQASHILQVTVVAVDRDTWKTSPQIPVNHRLPLPMGFAPGIGYLAWFLLIHFIRAVTPLSYFVLIYFWQYNTWTEIYNGGCSLFFLMFTFWICLEAIFYPYHQFVHRKLQRLRNPVHACKSLHERKILLRRCLDAIALASGGTDAIEIQKAHFDFLSRWFHGAPVVDIRRENLEEWIAWSFFYRDAATFSPADRAELTSLTDHAETLLRHRFPPGHSSSVRSIRLSLDPLRATQRPLVHYAVVSALRGVGILGVRALGFRVRRLGPHRYFYRPAADILPHASSDTLDGALRDDGLAAAATGALPIVFVHGLGVGFGHYLALIAGLPARSPAYLLEWPSTVMALGAEAGPDPAVTARLVQAALRRDGHAAACVVGHSYGSAAAAWMLRSRDPDVRGMVATVVRCPARRRSPLVYHYLPALVWPG
jgi:hypothetical protein